MLAMDRISRNHNWPRQWACLLAVSMITGAAPVRSIPSEAMQDWFFFHNTGSQYLKGGSYAKAEQRFRLAIQTIQHHDSGDRRLLARSYNELARVLYHQRRYAEAEPLAKWALTVREANSKVNPAEVFESLYTLGLIHRARQHHVEAERLLRRALEHQEKALGPGHENTALTIEHLAGIDCDQGDLAEAESLYRRALAIRERKAPAENLDLAETSARYATLLRRLNRPDEAEEWEARDLEIRDTVATKAARAKAARAAAGFQGFK